MLQWIAKIFARPDDEHALVATFERQDRKALVYSYTKPCGHRGYMVEVLFFVDTENAWMGSGIFAGEDLQTVVLVLQQSAQFIGQQSGSRPLPTVFLRGKSFLVDERLGELRGVDNPQERITLNDQE